MNYLNYLMMNLMVMLMVLIMVLVGVAFLTLMERKILGYIQDRKGPSKVGYGGIFQPFSDVIKLLSKEFMIISKSNYYIYFICPLISMFMMMILWMFLPISTNIYFMNYSILFVIVVMSIGSYMILLIGWSSNSIYSMLGSLRAVAQTLSYEVSFILIVLVIMLMVESFSLVDLIFWQGYMMFLFYLGPVYLVFFISILAELNRSPMDFIEGESELVSGFNVEYFSGGFTLIFLAEYGMIIFMSMLMILMFMGLDWGIFMFIMMIMMCSMVIFMRGILPRMRYDELMSMCWKIILPLILGYLILIMGLKFLFNLLI